MAVETPHAVPSPRVCEQARLSRDPRFDGLFFTAVTSTGIYCRPVCPAPAVKREHVRYFHSAAAAEAAGFRPCLRCRPELAPSAGSWQRGDAVVARALKLIDEGFLDEQSLGVLAERMAVGERQLRRLFMERLGAPPLSVHLTRRLLFAKQLLTETDLSITEVALEAGFSSLRRFNASFRDAYRMAPRDLRRRPKSAGDEHLSLRLAYRPPYEFAPLLDYLRTHSLPGVEVVDEQGYARVFGPRDAPGWFRVSAWPGEQNALQLQLYCPQPKRLLQMVSRVRRMFDLDADPGTIAAALAQDPGLQGLLENHPGMRIPGGWNGFEVAVRAVLGQQVNLAAARTLSARLVERFGQSLEVPFAHGLDRLFPTPEALADADLSAIGLPSGRAETVRGVARAVLDGRVDFQAQRTLDDFLIRWRAIPGIDAWTAQSIAMRALGHPDAFPTDDLLLRRAALNGGGKAALTTKALHARAERWRPWRAYAAIHLWRDAVGRRYDVKPPLRECVAETHDERRLS